MENNNPADPGGRRYGAEHVAQIATTCNQYLDCMEESLLQAISDMYSYTSLATITGATNRLIYTVVKNARQKLILEMGRQDTGPRFRLAYTLIAVALGCIGCSLLMYILLGDMPWLIFVGCILMLLMPFAFERED